MRCATVRCISTRGGEFLWVNTEQCWLHKRNTGIPRLRPSGCVGMTLLLKLFGAESLDGVDGGGAVRRDVAGDESGNSEKDGDEGEGGEVPAADLEEEAAEEGCG